MTDVNKKFEEWFVKTYRYHFNELVIHESVKPQIEAFLAGHASRDEEIEGLNATIDSATRHYKELRTHCERLYDALNCAHGYIDPNENKRTDKKCREALIAWEEYR